MSRDQCIATTQPLWEIGVPWTAEVSGRKGEKHVHSDLWNKQGVGQYILIMLLICPNIVTHCCATITTNV